MNTKIKLFSVGIVTLAGFFLGANFAFAQTATVVSCNSATINGTLTDTGGAATNVWFEWGTNYSSVDTGAGAITSSQLLNSPQNFSQTISGLNQNTTYYYRAVFSNTYGTSQGGTLSFTTPSCATQSYNNNYSQPYVSTNSASSIATNSATLNGYVNANGINVSAWFEWGTTYALGNTTSYNSYGTGSTSFNSGIYNLNPNTTYYYRAAAQSSYGTIYGSTISFTTSGTSYSYPNYGSAPTVSTLLATELTGGTARLNGLVFASNGQTSNAWYEWGTTASLGYKTQVTNVGALSTVKHSDYITGLAQGQTYYYRLVAQNSYGTSYGGVNSFVSTPTAYAVTPTPTTVNLKPTTVVVANGVSAQSLVTLSIEGGADMIGSGEKRTYHVSWKNVSAQPLKNVVLRVVFPKTMNVESATKGSFSAADNSVVVDLKTLAPKESGDTFIFATSARSLKPGELLVVTANMVFTGANGTQGDVVAYVTHTAETAQGGLGASVLNSGDFTPTTLLGWISVMVLTLLLVLLGNHLYGRFAEPKH